MEIFQQLRLESAHRLPKVSADHKCARVHGHSFLIEVWVEGQPGADTGWVIDYGDVSAAIAPVHDALDHRYLNDVEGLENPTSENLARWIWQRIDPNLPGLSRVVVRETCDTGCVYRGD